MDDLLEILGTYCAQISEGQYRPQAKWIRDMVFGIYVARSLMLSEIGRALDEDSRLIHTEKRLSRGLNSDWLGDKELLWNYLKHCAESTRKDDGEGVVVAVDYTDLSKPFARPDRKRGMEGACICYDGSRGTTGMGYPVVQLEAYLLDGTQRPLIFRPYSHAGESFASQTKEFVESIEQASPFVGRRAWWAMDRGFDGGRMFDALDELELRWVCRLKLGKNGRHLVDADGVQEHVKAMALRTVDRYKHTLSSKKRQPSRELYIGARKVYLPADMGYDEPPARTLIVVWGFGKDPLALLVSEHLEGKDAIVEAVLAYRRRWKAEEGTRGMKESRGWGVRVEDLRALKFRGVERLLLLAVLVYGFLAELERRKGGGSLLCYILGAVKTFGESPDRRYVLIRGMGRSLRRVERQLHRVWRRGFR